MSPSLKKPLNYLCLALMLVLLVLQFAPFWSVDGVGVSIGKYMWLPLNADECTALTQQLSTQIAGFEINSFVGTGLILQICFLFGPLLCLTSSDSPVSTIFPIIGSVTGLYSFLAVPVLRLGSTCMLQVLLCLALLVAAGFSLYVQLTARSHAAAVQAA